MKIIKAIIKISNIKAIVLLVVEPQSSSHPQKHNKKLKRQ